MQRLQLVHVLLAASVAMILTSTSTMGQQSSSYNKRLSKTEMPIVQAANAPLSDNIATASGSEPAIQTIKAPEGESSSTVDTIPSDTTGQDESDESDTSIEDECDPDMIGFEIITG